MGAYRGDRSWSDLMIPQIRQIVGPHLLRVTPEEMDCKQAADLFVFTARNMTIAARVRRPGYFEQYQYEFTVRSARDSGVTTELAKLIDGWGDWFFYGHASSDEIIAHWWLIDLVSFRAAMIRDGRKNEGVRLRATVHSNGDGTHFTAFDLRSFPAKPPILVASNHPLVALVQEDA